MVVRLGGSAWGGDMLLHGAWEHVVRPTRSRLSTVNGIARVDGDGVRGFDCGLKEFGCLQRYTLLLRSVRQVRSSGCNT